MIDVRQFVIDCTLLYILDVQVALVNGDSQIYLIL